MENTFKAQVKSKLALLEKNQNWLLEEVKKRAGDSAGFIDAGVLSAIISGSYGRTKRGKKGAYIRYIISEILDIKN